MKKQIIISFIVLSGLLSACQKNLDTFVPDPGQNTGPDTTWYGSVPEGMPVNALRTSLLLPLHRDSFQFNNGTAYTTVITNSGVRCTFAANSLVTLNNSIASQNIRLENLVVKKKGDMIRMEVPTTSDLHVLESEGALLLRASKDTAMLRLTQGTSMTINYPAPMPVRPATLYFTPPFTATIFNWVENTDSILNGLAVNNNEGYTITSSKLGWLCMANVYNPSAATTVLSAKLPSHYTNANTVVYLVFNNVNTVVKLVADPGAQKFRTIPVPVGELVTMVVLSKQGDDYYLGQKDLTTAAAAGQNVTDVAITPVRTPFDQVKQYLDGL